MLIIVCTVARVIERLVRPGLIKSDINLGPLIALLLVCVKCQVNNMV